MGSVLSIGLQFTATENAIQLLGCRNLLLSVGMEFELMNVLMYESV